MAEGESQDGDGGRSGTVMYVAKDLRSITLPDYSPGGQFAADATDRDAFSRFYPPCVWVRFVERGVRAGVAARESATLAFDSERDALAGLPRPRSAVPAWLLTPAFLVFLLRQADGIYERLTAAVAAGRTAPDRIEELHSRFDRIAAWASRAFAGRDRDVQREQLRQRRAAAAGAAGFILPAPPGRSHSPQVSLVVGDEWAS